MSSVLSSNIFLIRLHSSTADRALAAGGFGRSCTEYLFHPLLSLMGVEATVSPRAVHSRRVPSLGGYAKTRRRVIILLIGCFSGMLFGGIHCLGWFQGEIIWRGASLATLFAPVSISLCYGYAVLSDHWKFLPSTDIVFIIMAVISSAAAAIYITARIGLIVLMLMSLRSLPAGVYDTVAWTSFIPHY